MKRCIKQIWVLVMSFLLIVPNMYAIPKQNEYTVEIISTKVQNYLERIEEEVIYTGMTQENRYHQYPKDDYKYLLVQVKIDQVDNSLDLAKFQVNIEGQIYSKVKEDNFLKDYNMEPLSMEASRWGNLEGTLVFEIPKSIPEEKVKQGYLIYEELKMQKSLQENLNSNITYKENIVTKQFNEEIKILEEYYNYTYTLNNPYIIVNPYDIAPLTALVMFETKEEAKVTVKIVGKDTYTDIKYTLSNYNTHHEIPIIGLYAGEKNTVVVEVEDKNGRKYSKELYINTQPLPDNIRNKNVNTIINNKQEMQDGLIFVAEDNRVMIDANGDIRWFTTIHTDRSGVEEFLESGRILIPVNNWNRWSSMYEVDWLGKIHWIFTDGGVMHHDAEEMDNGNILFYLGDTLLEIDKKTGEKVMSKSVSEIMPYKEPEELRSKGTGDWFHENTIIYDNDDIIVSARNQHMVVKKNYKSEEVKWILSPSKVYKEYSDKYLKPIGDNFEWFYSQHQPSVLPDLDNNKDTIDILLFDNGVHRALKIEEALDPQDAYSRIVHYRINEKEMTVEQIWDFGKEMGTEFYAAIHSGAQYLEASGNYIGAFDASSQGWEEYFTTPQTSKVVEVTTEGEVVFQAEFDNSIYRAYKISEEQFSRGFARLGKQKGEIFLGSTAKPQQKQIIDDNGLSGKIKYDISNINYNNDYLDVEGWAYIEGKEELMPTIYLQLINDVSVYQYVLWRDNRINIPGLNDKKGFNEPYIDLNELPKGKYSMMLVLEDGEQKYSEKLPYYFTIENKEKNIIQTNNLIQQQNNKTEEIAQLLRTNTYTVQNPLVIKDPYNIAPLTAMIAFDTSKPSKVKIDVVGKQSNTTITYDFDRFETKHIIPVYGLYANYKNQIILTVAEEDGSIFNQTIEIITDKLPEDMVSVENKAYNNQIDDTVLFMASTYIVAVDNTGEIRWYLSDKSMGGGATPIQRLENGNIAIMSNRNINPMYYQTGVYEIDLLGRVYNEYIAQGAHHELQELENGNILIAAEKDDKTTEDYIVEIDRTTGEVVRDWDLGEILKMKKISDKTYQNQTYLENMQSMQGESKEKIKEATTEFHEHDWLHNNAFDYIEEEQAIVASSRHQDMIFKFDANTGEVKWILSDSSDSFPQHLQEKLLTPIGEEFEWQYGQHAVEQLPNGQILLYDNGNFRSKNIDDALRPNNNYSRAVIYNVNEESMTVEQVWQYGKERGNELYTPYIGDVDYIADNHYIINFGGIIGDGEGNRYDSPAALFTGNNTKGEAVVIEIKDNQVINEFKVTGPKNANTYRVEKMSLYDKQQSYIDLGSVGTRKGQLRETQTVERKLPTPTQIAYQIDEIKDEGDRVQIEAEILGAEKDEKIYIVLANDKDQYIYDTKNTSNVIKRYIHKTGIIKGNYNIGVLVEGKEQTYYTKTECYITIK